MPNLLANLPASLPAEVTDTLVRSTNLRIERITSTGHTTPEGYWYDQPEHEFVVLLTGAARLQFEDETVSLAAGDWLRIPAHRKHRVAWTSPAECSVWLAVFYQ